MHCDATAQVAILQQPGSTSIAVTEKRSLELALVQSAAELFIAGCCRMRAAVFKSLETVDIVLMGYSTAFVPVCFLHVSSLPQAGTIWPCVKIGYSENPIFDHGFPVKIA
jgi:hypothetical protein